MAVSLSCENGRIFGSSLEKILQHLEFVSSL